MTPPAAKTETLLSDVWECVKDDRCPGGPMDIMLCVSSDSCGCIWKRVHDARERPTLTERLSLSQQDRHTLEVECRDLRVQNDKLRRELEESNDVIRVAVQSELGDLWLWPLTARETWMSRARAAISQTEG